MNNILYRILQILFTKLLVFFFLSFFISIPTNQRCNKKVISKQTKIMHYNTVNKPPKSLCAAEFTFCRMNVANLEQTEKKKIKILRKVSSPLRGKENEFMCTKNEDLYQNQGN